MELLVILYLLLLILGAKATWNLVLNFFPSVSDDIVFAVIIFAVLFLVLGPVMGLITIVKYIYSRVKSGN